jgi:predicted ester cyclase
MSVEQVAREFITSMANEAKVKSMLTPDAMVSGGVLPKPMPAMEAFGMIAGMKAAFPDLWYKVEQVAVNGDKATVQATFGGTNSGTLSLPIPGLPSLPPTEKKISVKDAFVVTVRGDKVAQMHVDSPADGGIPAALAQLGVKLPAM